MNASWTILELEAISDDCSSLFCVATATCSAGKTVVFGTRATDSFLCDTIPLNCNEYCTPGLSSCAATSTVSAASVHIVCGKVA